MKPCFMVQQTQRGGGGGGGNGIYSENYVIVRRTSAIGDSLCSSVVADRLIDLGFDVNFQTHPANHCILRRHPRIAKVSEPNEFCHVDLDQSYERDPQRRIKHFHTMFFEAAQRQLMARGIALGQPLNCTPSLRMPPNDREAARQRLSAYPHPWVFVCPRSDSYNVRQVPDGIWSAAASKMKGSKFWIGRHPAPPNFVDLKCQHFDTVISYLSVADLMVSVDTGPLHVAAAFGIPIVALGQSSSPELHLSDQRDFITIEPKLDCVNCQSNLCPINQWVPPCQNFDPDFIAAWTNAKLQIYDTENVSAIVSIYKPEVGLLNECLNALLPQVQEIIVTAEANSRIPDGANKDSKIRYVRKPMAAIGYGRNTNFGARHSTGKYLLLINDDCILKPHAVERMLDVIRTNERVGIVSNLLWYPEGTIYHSGKLRSPGERGWGHVNLRQRTPGFTKPVELENCCGCCILVPRKCFYEIKGFDEDFFIYAEDDDLALRMRRAGYRIFFTPHSEGIHYEHQSTRKLDNIADLVRRANGIFGSKWNKYFEHNANRVPLGNFDY